MKPFCIPIKTNTFTRKPDSMKTHFRLITLVLFLVVFMFEGCTKKEDHSYPHELVFLTEDYPPLNYNEGGS